MMANSPGDRSCRDMSASAWRCTALFARVSTTYSFSASSCSAPIPVPFSVFPDRRSNVQRGNPHAKRLCATCPAEAGLTDKCDNTILETRHKSTQNGGLMSTATGQKTTWKFDTAHSHVGFSVRHMMITTVKGRFAGVEGEIQLDEENPADSYVKVTMDAATVDTGIGQRDDHLRSG